MALDPTARRANVKDSLKKFFVDNLVTTEGLVVSFDTSMRTPVLRGQPIEVDRWVGIDIGPVDVDMWTNFRLYIYNCTRKDPEGYRLAQLRDTVTGYLTDSTKDDGVRRITFYRSYASKAWTSLGGILLLSIMEGEESKAPDETKYIMQTCRCGFVSKV